MDNKKGIALIMAVGVLALLAIIATSFALNMRLEYHAATNYYNGVKARYFAEAALERAIAELRLHVKQSAFDDLVSPTETWGTSGYDNASYLTASKTAGYINSPGMSKTTIINDEQRKININNANATLIGNLLTEDGIASPSTRGTDIVSGRSAASYNGTRELFTRNNVTNITKEDFADIKNHITAYSYIDTNTGYAPVNVNTADDQVMIAVLANIASNSSDDVPVDGSISRTNAVDVVSKIKENRPLNSWQGFNDAVDEAVSAGYITAAQATIIKYNCNPNRPKPSTPTTEFCFNSGGYYEIIARGTVTDFLNIAQADRTLSTVVKIYDIYCETKVKDAAGNPTQFALGTPNRVTWLDSCPVRSDQVFGVYEIPSDAEKIKGSIKLGFWDDFNTDTDGGDRTYSKKHWKRNLSTNASDSDFDNGQLVTLGGVRFDLFGTDGSSEWTWADFGMRVYADEFNLTGTQMQDVAWLLFRNNTGIGLIPSTGNPALIHARQGVLSWENDEKFAYLDTSDLDGKVAFMTIDEILNSSINPYPHYRSIYNLTTVAYPIEADRIQAAINARYKYDRDGDGQIRIFTLYKMGDDNPTYPEWENYDIVKTGWEWLKKDLAYANTKMFILSANSGNVHAEVWTGSSTSASLDRTINGTSGSGRTVLYGNNASVRWDDLRIISKDGYYRSRVIDPTPAIAGDTVGWGTMARTVTIPSTASAGAEAISFATSVNGWSSIEGIPTSLSIGSAKSGTIQYLASFNSSNSSHEETPVLEDVTITYLPKVAIKSYSLSN